MTDSYHFASVPQFRVGGVYRQKNGIVVILRDDKHNPEPGMAWARHASGDWGEGFRCLTTGADTIQLEQDGRDLIPGELHQVNGEWVPVEQKLSFPSGSVLTTSGDKIVGREEPPFAGDFPFLPKQSTADCLRGALDKLAARCEPKRPALTWRTETPFDPFKGFDVEWSVECQAHPAGFASPDLQATSPLCGSAYLLPKTA